MTYCPGTFVLCMYVLFLVAEPLVPGTDFCGANVVLSTHLLEQILKKSY